MLKIRPEQMQVFRQVAETAFIRRLAEHLRQHYTDSGVLLPTGVSTVRRIPDEMLLEMVRSGTERARRYGITHESALAAFVAMMIETAPNFDEHPGIQPLLTDESVPPNSRLDKLLEESLLEQHREEIKQSYDQGAWALKPEE